MLFNLNHKSVLCGKNAGLYVIELLKNTVWLDIMPTYSRYIIEGGHPIEQSKKEGGGRQKRVCRLRLLRCDMSAGCGTDF